MDNYKDYIDPETGEISATHPAMQAIPARSWARMNENGSERLNPTPLVSPLLRPPTLEERIRRMTQSGELAQLYHQSQRLMDNNDDDFDGFERDFFEENIPTAAEMANLHRNSPKEPPQAPKEPPQASNEPSPSTPPASPPDEAERAPNAGGA